MSKENFTRGEWFVEEYHTMLDISVVEHGGVCTVHTDTAMREHLIDPTPEQAANAHLIAAAPDMYRMLSKLSMYVNGFDDGGVDFKSCEQVANDIQKLLAKARGE